MEKAMKKQEGAKKDNFFEKFGAKNPLLQRRKDWFADFSGNQWQSELEKRRQPQREPSEIYGRALLPNAQNVEKMSQNEEKAAYDDKTSMDKPETSGLDAFKTQSFTVGNSLNQLDLDKALGLDTDGTTTASCQTSSMINAYAANVEGGITGGQILSALTNENGSMKNFLDSYDASPTNLDALSRSISDTMGLDKYLSVSDKHLSLKGMSDLSPGLIVGKNRDGNDKTQTVDGKIVPKDNHFTFMDLNHGATKGSVVDSLDPNRPTAKNYHSNTYRVLKWADK